MNVFVERIAGGKIKTLSQLKSCYRTLAKSIHPDTAAIDRSGDLFIKLRRDFDEAKILIQGKESGRCGDGEEDYRSLFQHLIASGFPLDGRARTTKAYRDRVERFRSVMDRKGIEGAGKFSDVEGELARMRGEGVVQNPLFGNVRLLFYQIVSYHHYPTPFTFFALGKIYDEIKGDLRAKGFASLDAFLGWMIGDLREGASPRDR